MRGLGQLLAVDGDLVIATAAAGDHNHDPDRDRQGQHAGDHVAEDQPPALGGRLPLFRLDPFQPAAFTFLLAAQGGAD